MKKTAIIDALVGAVRAGNLSDNEMDKLRKKYGLDDDANLVLRNVGRGMIGGMGGAALGRLASNALVASAVSSAMKGGMPTGRLLLAELAPLAGFGIGTKLMTDKYSKGALKKHASCVEGLADIVARKATMTKAQA